MVAINNVVRNRREAFVAELIEVALPVIVRYGTGGDSVALEVQLWKRLELAVDELARGSRGAESNWDHRLAVLSRAVYEVALNRAVTGPFLDLEMSLWKELRRVVRNNRFVPGNLAELADASRSDSRLSGILALR